jgi:hypothetical protein
MKYASSGVLKMACRPSFAPPAGTVTVRVSRLYAGAPDPVYSSRCPVCGCAAGPASPLSTASQYLMPSFSYAFSSYRPTVIMARYDAIGSSACQVHVVVPVPGVRPVNAPFATAVSPSGTVIRVV